MKKLFVLTILAVFSQLPSLAHAQISVDRVIINFPANQRPIQNIVIRNNGTELMGIDVIAEKVLNPGTDKEKRVETDEVIISPRRLSIKPRNQRTARLLLKKLDRSVEHVYRIKLMPKAGGFDSDDTASQSEKKTMLKVITTVGLLVFVEPQVPQTKLTWELGKNGLTFKNEGNINMFLDEGQACIRKDFNCESLPSTRLYAGNSWTIPVPQGKNHISFRKNVKGEFENFVVQ